MKNKFLILTALGLFNFLSAQVASIDFFFIKDGMEKEYLELEKVWVEFHKQMIEEGKMFGWSLYKIESTNNVDGDAPDYMTLNRFESKEAMESMWEGMNYDVFLKIVKKKLKGKMSTKKIKQIVEAKVKESHHSYLIELNDQTLPSVEMNVGEILNVDAMVQRNEDYESLESNFAKPIVQDNVKQGNLKWWGFTKVIDRNDQAIKEISHFTWQIRVPGKRIKWMSETSKNMFGGEFTFGKLSEMMGASRDVMGSAKLKLIMKAI